MHITILPADTYTIIQRSTITDLDRRLITLLYQPIIGYTAVSLYYTLLDDLEKQDVMSGTPASCAVPATWTGPSGSSTPCSPITPSA